MHPIKIALIGTFFSAATIVSATAQAAGNASAGQQKSATCQACHGAYGEKTVDKSQPILAGQYESYLIHALKSYRSGERQNPIMGNFAATLSDQDITDLAAWFSSQDKGLSVIPRKR